MSTAKHLPLQKFEAIDMPFHDPVVPWKPTSRLHSSIIPTDPISKTLEFGDLALRRPLKPVSKQCRFALFEQADELLSQVIRSVEFLVLVHLRKLLLLSLSEFL